MKDINKYTKSELINKIKTVEKENSDKTKVIKFLDYILKFKSIILKITLITFIIRWIKKYSLITKIWHIFNIISSALLGISLIDIYYWDVISWIKETSIFKWYAELFSKVSIETNSSPNVDSPNIEFRPVEFQQNMNENNIEQANGVQKTNDSDDRQINRNINKEIINEEVLTIEQLNKLNTQFETNYNKYLIIAGVIITASICYYYSDEIRTGAISLFDWINSFRTGTGDSAGSDANSSRTPTSTNFPKLDRLNESVPSSPDIELIDKGKTKLLTSQSLKDLNEKVKEKWSEGSNSPSGSSSSSSETITPDIFQQEAALKIANTMWRQIIPIEFQDKIQFIEDNIKNISDLKIKDKMIESFVELQSDKIEFVAKFFTIKSEKLMPEVKIIQSEVAINNLDKWFKEFYDKI